MSTITINEIGKPAVPVPVVPKAKLDLQDYLVVFGFITLETGTGLINVPASLILAGLMFLIAATLIQKSKASTTEKK